MLKQNGRLRDSVSRYASCSHVGNSATSLGGLKGHRTHDVVRRGHGGGHCTELYLLPTGARVKSNFTGQDFHHATYDVQQLLGVRKRGYLPVTEHSRDAKCSSLKGDLLSSEQQRNGEHNTSSIGTAPMDIAGLEYVVRRYIAWSVVTREPVPRN